MPHVVVPHEKDQSCRDIGTDARFEPPGREHAAGDGVLRADPHLYTCVADAVGAPITTGGAAHLARHRPRASLSPAHNRCSVSGRVWPAISGHGRGGRGRAGEGQSEVKIDSRCGRPGGGVGRSRADLRRAPVAKIVAFRGWADYGVRASPRPASVILEETPAHVTQNTLPPSSE